jgi:carboxyl-terminal processing protease
MQELDGIRRYRQSILMGSILGLTFGIVFVLGFLFHDFLYFRSANAATNLEKASYGLLFEVQSLLDAYYLRTQPEPRMRDYAAIRGMLATLNDPYTFFVDPPVAQSESDALAGTYGGIGVQIHRSEDGKLELFPLPDSPASKSGIGAGDILIAVNSQTVDQTIQQDVLDQMFRGEVKEGNGVLVSYLRLSDSRQIDVFIPFAVINIPSVTWRMLPSEIGYIQIQLFTGRTPDEITTALQELLNSGARGIILDLRGNSGGLLRESVLVASQFVGEGVVVYEKKNDKEIRLDAETGGQYTTGPLVVLVNKGTASAAELVAGAIRDRGRGILVGQTTYGKGSVQQIFRLSDDSSLHVTSAEWLTPTRQQIEGKGLEPDIIMIPDANGRDIELGEAVRVIESMIQD